MEIELPFHRTLTQQHGYLHAAAATAIADSACGYAAYTLAPEGTEVLTVEFKVNFLAPAEGALVAKASVLRNGRVISTCMARVFDLKTKRMVAVMTATIFKTPHQTEGARRRLGQKA